MSKCLLRLNALLLAICVIRIQRFVVFQSWTHALHDNSLRHLILKIHFLLFIIYYSYVFQCRVKAVSLKAPFIYTTFLKK